MEYLTKKQKRKADKILSLIFELYCEGVYIATVSTPDCKFRFVRSEKLPEFDDFVRELNSDNTKIYGNRDYDDKIFFDCFGL